MFVEFFFVRILQMTSFYRSERNKYEIKNIDANETNKICKIDILDETNKTCKIDNLDEIKQICKVYNIYESNWLKKIVWK